MQTNLVCIFLLRHKNKLMVSKLNTILWVSPLDENSETRAMRREKGGLVRRMSECDWVNDLIIGLIYKQLICRR